MMLAKIGKKRKMEKRRKKIIHRHTKLQKQNKMSKDARF